MRKTLTLMSGLILASGMAFADEMNHSTMDHGNMAMDEATIEGGVHVKAIVNAFGDGTVNVSHEPIPQIGWPAMTMDLPLMENAQMMDGIANGDAVTMMLVRDADGMYVVAALMPEM